MPTPKWRELNKEKMKLYRREWYNRNKEQEQKKARSRGVVRRQEMRKWYTEYKSTLSCIICSESESVCLDFHHKNSKQKEFSIGHALDKGKLSMMKEIKKCIVLCANCHRKLHAGLIKLGG
jgi:uncharacterized protein affecting Mg2+/Co2+ transport